VVAVGFAVTVAPVVADKPAAGLHAYVVAPLAVSVTVPLEHIVADVGEIVTVGGGFGETATVTVVVPTQPAADVPITV